MQTKDKYPESIVNPNFQKLLDKFHAVIKGYPKIETVKDKLISLKEEALTILLTGHQRDAIIARSNNYLNNDYGEQRKKNKDHISDLAQIQETRKNKVKIP